MEIMDLYDKDRQPLHETSVRGVKLPKGKYRIVVHICIINDKNEMLIQQRQSTKKIFADMWDITAGGQVSAGETSAESAERELAEEMGIHIDMSDMRPSFTMNFDDGFDDVYLLRENVDIDQLTLQAEEVQSAKWATRDEILEMIDKGIFIHYHQSYIDLLFTMVDEDGTFSEG